MLRSLGLLLAILSLAFSADSTHRSHIVYDGSLPFVFAMLEAVEQIEDANPPMYRWMEQNEVRIIHWVDSPYEIVMGYNSEARWIWIGRAIYGSPQENAHWIVVAVRLMQGDIDGVRLIPSGYAQYGP